MGHYSLDGLTSGVHWLIIKNSVKAILINQELVDQYLITIHTLVW